MNDRRLTLDEILQRKNAMPLVCLTAYSAPVAKILDKHADILLVGDSVGMALYGMDNTRDVSVEMMIAHGKAVVKASQRAFIVVDLPFGSYEDSPQQALESAQHIIAQTRADAVKLEGGEAMAETIAYLCKHDVSVMGHIGLLPQHVVSKDGFKYQGRDAASAASISADAQAVASAGAFAVVLEAVVESVAQEVTDLIDIPTIGIGASASCDGQILVTEDMAGLFTDFKPKFVRRFGNLAQALDVAASDYKEAVTARQFPAEQEIVSGGKPVQKSKKDA